MDAKFEQLLINWKKPYLWDQDLMTVFPGEDSRRYDAVKYALKKEILVRIRRGLYQISPPYKQEVCDPFEMAQLIYGPSYISYESALSHHGWIPEAVYTITSATNKRSKIFKTPIGIYCYYHIPTVNFYLNVARVSNKSRIFLIADPWKAIADYIFTHRKRWKSIRDLSGDMRIDIETMEQSDKMQLKQLCNDYPKTNVRKILSLFMQELY